MHRVLRTWAEERKLIILLQGNLFYEQSHNSEWNIIKTVLSVYNSQTHVPMAFD